MNGSALKRTDESVVSPSLVERVLDVRHREAQALRHARYPDAQSADRRRAPGQGVELMTVEEEQLRLVIDELHHLWCAEDRVRDLIMVAIQELELLVVQDALAQIGLGAHRAIQLMFGADGERVGNLNVGVYGNYGVDGYGIRCAQLDRHTVQLRHRQTLATPDR
jgi:hypothetical protein